MGFRWPHRWPAMAPDAFSKNVEPDHDAHGFSDLFVAEQDDRDRYLEDYLDNFTAAPVPGNVIGFSTYAPAITAFKTPTGVLSPVDAANINVTFTAPASGKVIVYLSTLCYPDTSASALLMAWGVLDHTSGVQYGPAVVPIQSISNTTSQTVKARMVIPIYIRTGLVAGTTYTVDFAYIGNPGSTNTLTYGAQIATVGTIPFASSIDMLVVAA